jgi:hypothetical protein
MVSRSFQGSEAYLIHAAEHGLPFLGFIGLTPDHGWEEDAAMAAR